MTGVDAGVRRCDRCAAGLHPSGVGDPCQAFSEASRAPSGCFSVRRSLDLGSPPHVAGA